MDHQLGPFQDSGLATQEWELESLPLISQTKPNRQLAAWEPSSGHIYYVHLRAVGVMRQPGNVNANPKEGTINHSIRIE